MRPEEKLAQVHSGAHQAAGRQVSRAARDYPNGLLFGRRPGYSRVRPMQMRRPLMPAVALFVLASSLCQPSLAAKHRADTNLTADSIVPVRIGKLQVFIVA